MYIYVVCGVMTVHCSEAGGREHRCYVLTDNDLPLQRLLRGGLMSVTEGVST